MASSNGEEPTFETSGTTTTMNQLVGPPTDAIARDDDDDGHDQQVATTGTASAASWMKGQVQQRKAGCESIPVPIHSRQISERSDLADDAKSMDSNAEEHPLGGRATPSIVSELGSFIHRPGKTTPSIKLKDGHPEWWEQWKKRLANKPVNAELRFTFARVWDIDEREQEFSAHVRIECTIPDMIVETPETRLPGIQERKGYFIDIGDNKLLEEFNPKLVIPNIKRTHFGVSKWIRREKNQVRFCLEVAGWFGVHVGFLEYPVDVHKLSIQVSSDWSSDYLRLSALSEHQYNIADQFEMKREYNLYPHVDVAEKENNSTKGNKYSQVNAAVLVRRKALGMFLLLMSRPFIFTSLAFGIVAMPPTTDDYSLQVTTNDQILSNRLQVVLILLLASTVEKSSTVFTFLDYYSGIAFFILAGLAMESMLVFSRNPDPKADVIGISVLGALWIFTNIVMFLAAYCWYKVADLKRELWEANIQALNHARTELQKHMEPNSGPDREKWEKSIRRELAETRKANKAVKRNHWCYRLRHCMRPTKDKYKNGDRMNTDGSAREIVMSSKADN